jgi:hypothetical protein
MNAAVELLKIAGGFEQARAALSTVEEIGKRWGEISNRGGKVASLSTDVPPRTAYLDDLPESDFKTANRKLAKHGVLWQKKRDTRKIEVNGQTPDHSLSLAVSADGSAHVSYRIDGKYVVFKGVVMVDGVASAGPPLVAKDHLGVTSRLWVVTDTHAISTVTGLSPVACAMMRGTSSDARSRRASSRRQM